MTIYVVKTFQGYWLTASKEEAELKANKLYDELKHESEEYRVKKQDVWARIDVYQHDEYLGAPFKYVTSYWANKM